MPFLFEALGKMPQDTWGMSPVAPKYFHKSLKKSKMKRILLIYNISYK